MSSYWIKGWGHYLKSQGRICSGGFYLRPYMKTVNLQTWLGFWGINSERWFHAKFLNWITMEECVLTSNYRICQCYGVVSKRSRKPHCGKIGNRRTCIVGYNPWQSGVSSSFLKVMTSTPYFLEFNLCTRSV
jgi:hypothetical protein